MIYVVEDDPGIRELECYALKQAGFEARGFEEGEAFLEAVRVQLPKLVLLDVMLPGEDGNRLLARLRQDPRTRRLPVIMVTARGEEMDKVQGLDGGADDYVTKPFSPVELTARVDALIRRSSGGTQELPPGTISQPPFLLNTRNRTLEKNGQRIKLTQVEYSIMRMFMENPGKALSREEILDLVWGRDYFGELKIVDVNVRRLRLKIEDSPTSPTYINTVWGYGYKWGF
ncbi:MAG TPA: DNA-binding response regulator [Oscillibacter sp.]|nr:DNA-binding response regulator [Oscillibacter sp.]